jgi:hypothetical protein
MVLPRMPADGSRRNLVSCPRNLPVSSVAFSQRVAVQRSSLSKSTSGKRLRALQYDVVSLLTVGNPLATRQAFSRVTAIWQLLSAEMTCVINIHTVIIGL